MNFKYTCSGFLCHVCGLVSPSSLFFFFMVFNLSLGPGFIFEPCCKFFIFQQIYSLD